MRLDRFLSCNTAYSRQQIRREIAQGQVLVDGCIVTDGRQQINAFSEVRLADQLLQSRTARYLMLNKPIGCLSATTDSRHKTVMTLINESYTSELHIAGRLDFNTSGLMLLTNDGRWSRRLTQPDEKTPKTYLVETEDPIGPDYQQYFAQPLYFPYEGVWTQPAQLQQLAPRQARLTIYEGRYHQIKRMFGRFNNKVTALHRESVGNILLDPTLAPGCFRSLTALEIKSAAEARQPIVNADSTAPI